MSQSIQRKRIYENENLSFEARNSRLEYFKIHEYMILQRILINFKTISSQGKI